MEPIELHVVTLTHSVSSSNSYAVILKERNGYRRIPMVIGGFEAQSIAIALEGMPTGRPLTHDLFKNVFKELNVELDSVFISELRDGIFHAYLNCKVNNDIYQIDARASDSIALAVRFGCPIFTTNEILEEASIAVEDEHGMDVREAEEDELVELSSQSKNLDDLSVSKLRKLLDEVLEREDYEEAARIRDAIQRKNS